MKALIIVESPAKIKTLKKFLGKDFLFASSVGHIRDLPKKGFGIDVEGDFEPQYEPLAEKKDVIAELRKVAKEADVVYLSPDPDREGEAIAWHIAELLPAKTKIKRTTFNAITKDAVLEALDHPREIDFALVNAQQARRLLDRIVGYKISPILGRKLSMWSGVSAGRVQSVALKLVVDREKEIEAFKPVEYWNLGAILRDGEPTKQFPARVYKIDGKRWEKEPVEGKDVALIGDAATAEAVEARLNRAAYTVVKVVKKEKKRNPEAPFITSTLQQEASRHFRFSSSKTMQVAQGLYEGVNGSEGLITYMRTDSVRIEPGAINAARAYIKGKYGAEMLPEKPRVYSTKKSAQDAHEAIRPSSLNNPPEKVKKFLNRDQYVLYELIWNRFIASQMKAAVYDTIAADIETDQGIDLRATGSMLKYKGFLAIYEEKRDEEEEREPLLPPLTEGQVLKLVEVTKEQAFTKPPPRFTEAALVKELEKSGIGRPSTYASIMNKIQGREYTVKEQHRLKPTELGRVIAQFLETHFAQIMDVSFTANMEDTLELIAADKKEWKAVLREFWDQFIPTVETAEKEAHVPKIDTELECPKCGAHLQKIWSKKSYFFGCSKYPDCDYTTSEQEMAFSKEDYAEGFDWEQPCPLCQGEMKLRHGRYGPFLGCTKYPDCKGIVNIPKKGEEVISQQDLPPCPAVGCEGRVVARKSRYGKLFYSCSSFPDCDVIGNSVDQLSEKYVDHPKTAYVKKARPKGKGRGGGRKFTLSPELAAVCGEKELGRGEVTKKIWEYIKKHKCQDPNDKRTIIPDEKLAKVFGSSEPVNMFQMAGLLTRHFK